MAKPIIYSSSKLIDISITCFICPAIWSMEFFQEFVKPYMVCSIWWVLPWIGRDCLWEEEWLLWPDRWQWKYTCFLSLVDLADSCWTKLEFFLFSSSFFQSLNCRQLTWLLCYILHCSLTHKEVKSSFCLPPIFSLAQSPVIFIPNICFTL